MRRKWTVRADGIKCQRWNQHVQAELPNPPTLDIGYPSLMLLTRDVGFRCDAIRSLDGPDPSHHQRRKTNQAVVELTRNIEIDKYVSPGSHAKNSLDERMERGHFFEREWSSASPAAWNAAKEIKKRLS